MRPCPAARRLGRVWVLGFTLFGVPVAGATGLVPPHPSSAHPPPAPIADPCGDAVRDAEHRHATPPGLLAAIARTESGRVDPASGAFRPWPWAVNIAGAGYYPDSKPAAIRLVRQELDRGAGPVDVGCMQVSLTHHPRAFRSLDDALDPTMNVDYAARFLVSLRDAAEGNWFTAVGLYHSRTPELARLYRDRVSLAGTAIRPVGRNRLRVTLANGRVFTINTARQPGRRGRARSACEVAMILGPYAAPAVRAQACATAR